MKDDKYKNCWCTPKQPVRIHENYKHTKKRTFKNHTIKSPKKTKNPNKNDGKNKYQQ